jgi:hypothetical protein
MSKRTETSRQVVIHNKNSTETYNKNSAGCTTREGYTRYNHNTGNTTNSYGKIVDRKK